MGSDVKGALRWTYFNFQVWAQSICWWDPTVLLVIFGGIKMTETINRRIQVSEYCLNFHRLRCESWKVIVTVLILSLCGAVEWELELSVAIHCLFLQRCASALIFTDFFSWSICKRTPTMFVLVLMPVSIYFMITSAPVFSVYMCVYVCMLHTNHIYHINIYDVYLWYIYEWYVNYINNFSSCWTVPLTTLSKEKVIFLSFLINFHLKFIFLRTKLLSLLVLRILMHESFSFFDFNVWISIWIKWISWIQ